MTTPSDTPTPDACPSCAGTGWALSPTRETVVECPHQAIIPTMNGPRSTEALEAIRKRAEAATPGEWTYSYTMNSYWPYSYRIWRQSKRNPEISTDISLWPEEDADFITHARTDIPFLLDQIATLQSHLASIKSEQGEREVTEEIDFADFAGPKRNVGWQPDLQELIYQALLGLDGTVDADEDAAEQIIERLLVVLQQHLPTASGAEDRVLSRAQAESILANIEEYADSFDAGRAGLGAYAACSEIRKIIRAALLAGRK